MDLLSGLALGGAVLGVGFFVASLVALKRGRALGSAFRLAFGLLLLSLSALLTTIRISTQGYSPLTREEVAASVFAEPMGGQRFNATVTFPDGRTAAYELAGDQLYIDAHILKWKPIVNILGLHTAYELDRVGGRYDRLDEEQDSTRTVRSLKLDKPLDMFALRSRYRALQYLLDVEYGSATFVPITEPGTFEVRVSTTGLLVRRADP